MSVEGSLIGFKYNNTIYYYIKNMQEDIISLTDSSYNLVCSYEYDSWGKLISIKDNNNNIITNSSHIRYINPFRYRSYYYDNETKLYYLNSRYYNPEWGRFVNADSYLGVTGDILGYNLYLYASNNPINNSDEEGRFFKKAWNWVKKKASQATKKVEQIYTKAKESFVFEAEAGFWFGYHTNVAGYGIDVGFEKTVGYNNQSGSYTSTSAGGNLSLRKIDFVLFVFAGFRIKIGFNIGN